MTLDARADPSETAFDAWFSPGRFVLFLTALLLALYPDVIFGNRSFVFRDFGFFAYPMAHHHRESFWSGEVPLWNPLNDCGLPFLAQWNSMVCYPLSLLYLLVPPAWSLTFFCLFHLVLGGAGMYCLARFWTRSRFAAAVAGIGYAFNGLALNCLIYPNNIAALGWMPWVVASTERGWRSGGRRLAEASVIGAMQMLTGAPEVILFTWLFAGMLWGVNLIRGREARKPAGSRFAVVALMVTGLAAVQLLPFLDLLAHSQRENSYADFENSMPGTGWANFLVPLFRSYRSPQGVYFQSTQAWTSSYYMGIGLLALAILAAVYVRSWRVRVAGVALLCSAVLALGDNTPVYVWLRTLVPQLGFMSFPIKFVILITFCAPLMAAAAAGEFSGRNRIPLRRVVVAGGIGLLLIAGIVGFAHAYPHYYERWPRIFRNGLERAGFLILTLAALWSLSRLREIRQRVLAGGALLLILWGDVATHVPRQNPTVQRGALEPGIELLQKLAPRPVPGHSRAMLSAELYRQFARTFLADPLKTYLGHRLGLYFNCNLLEGLSKVDGMYSLYLQEQLRALFLLYEPTPGYASNLADFMTVSHVSAKENLLDWQARDSFMPFITGGQRPVFGGTEEITRGLISSSFNPRETVWLDVNDRTRVAVTNRTTVAVREQKVSRHYIRFEATTTNRSLAVISQSHHHPWKAYLDGTPVPVLRANLAFQAVLLPPGTHRVELQYEDWGFRIGALIAMATLGVTTLIWRTQCQCGGPPT